MFCCCAPWAQHLGRNHEGPSHVRPSGTALPPHGTRSWGGGVPQDTWSCTSGNARKDSAGRAFELRPAKLSSTSLRCGYEQPLRTSAFLPSQQFSSFLRFLSLHLILGWQNDSFCTSNQYQNDANVHFDAYNSIPPHLYPTSSLEGSLDYW